ncbi:hypothetical protein FA95DRAFT_1592204, partial [Auriscalpium vulgare]
MTESSLSAGTDATVHPPTRLDDPFRDDANHAEDFHGARLLSSVYANKLLLQMQARVIQECEAVMKILDKVRLWVNSILPKNMPCVFYSNGQYAVILHEIANFRESLLVWVDGVSDSHLQRAKICSDLINYPNVEDYALALKGHDEKEMFHLRHYMVEILFIYAAVARMLE